MSDKKQFAAVMEAMKDFAHDLRSKGFNPEEICMAMASTAVEIALAEMGKDATVKWLEDSAARLAEVPAGELPSGQTVGNA